jgi:catechol 2,3-dioxygenase-like lactoylglutathione lyase family enzyme
MIVARSLLSLMCLVSVFSVAALAQSAPGNPVPPGFKLSPLARATVFVRDVDESLELYRDILGLQSGDVVYGNVGLFQLSGGDTPAASAPSAATRVNPGDVALVFNTTNIDGIAAAVKAAGYPIIAMPMVLFPREDMEVQPLEMLFRDRDGTLVNLIQQGRRKGE